MTADGAGAAASRGPLGILAGGGSLPEQIAELTIARGRAVHIVAIKGEAGAGIERFPHTWVNWGGIGRMSASWNAAGCRDPRLHAARAEVTTPPRDCRRTRGAMDT